MREKDQPGKDQWQEQVIAAAAHREAQPPPAPPAGERRTIRHDWEEEEPERWDGMA